MFEDESGGYYRVLLSLAIVGLDVLCPTALLLD